MDEARRLVRYVFPGILYGIETSFFLWIVLPDWTSQVLSSALTLSSLGGVLAATLASGAIGYVFATLHHWLHWHSPTDLNIIDHTQAIRDLRRDGVLPNRDADEHPRLEAFDTMTAEWSIRSTDGTPCANATERARAFGDLAHSAGTARVASALALLTAITTCMIVAKWTTTTPAVLRYIFMLLLGILLTALFHETYRRTGGMGQRFYERVLERALRERRVDG